MSAAESASATLSWLDQAQMAQDYAHLSRRVRKRPLVLFFGRATFSDNSKYLYLHMLAGARGYEVLWVTGNDDLWRSLSGAGLPVLHLGQDMDLSINLLLHAAVAVYTVNPHESLAESVVLGACLAGARQVQLWHGISVKRLTLQLVPHMSTRSLDVRRPWVASSRVDHVLSTAPCFDGYWREVFGCRSPIRAGLPRNEVIGRQASEAELIGATLPEALQAPLQSQAAAILVAPTWQRGKATPLTEPPFLDRLEAFGSRHGCHFFLKAHPTFTGRDSGLAVSGGHVHLVDAGLDIYPWLFRFQALVTDYSSLMFDHLLSGHPVLSLALPPGAHQSYEPDFSLVPEGEFRYLYTPQDIEARLLQALGDDPLRPARAAYARQIFSSDPQQACADLATCLDRLVEASQQPDWTTWIPGSPAPPT